MKTPTKIAIAGGAVLVLIAAVAALAFTPFVQKWALKRAVPGAEAEHISAGMSSAEIKNLRMEKDGARITIPSASAEYSAWAYLTGGAIQISNIEARGVVVDLRSYTPADTDESATQPFEGILGALLLPAGLQLKAADIDAEMILPSEGAPEGKRVALVLKGGGVGAGSEAVFNYEVTYADPTPGSPLTAVKAIGRLTSTVAANGSVSAVSAQAEIVADGADIPAGERIILDAGSKLDAAGKEAFSIKVARRSPEGVETQLLEATSAFNESSRSWEGGWSVAIDDKKLAALLNPGTTPSFEMTGEGRYTFNPASSASTASGEITGWSEGIERMVPELAGVGRVTYSAAFGGSADEKTARVETARAAIAGARGDTLFSATLKQAVELTLESGHVAVRDPAAPAGTLEFGNLPLAWVEPFVSGAKLSGSVTGGAMDLFFTADGYAVSTTTPVTVREMSVAMDGAPLLERVDATWDGRASISPKETGMAVSASVRSFELRQGATLLLTLKSEIESNGATTPDAIRGTAKGSFDANLGALLAQPVAAEFRVLESGRATGTYDLAAAEQIAAKLRIDAKGLVAAQERRALGDATLSLDARLDPGKDGEFSVPLVITNAGRKSDLTVSGSFKQGGEIATLNARISGDTVYTEDVQALAILVPSGGTDAESPAAPAGAPGPGRDAKPFWSGAAGTVSLDIKNLIQSADNAITNLKAQATVAAQRLALDKFEGTVSGSPVTATAELKFEDAAERPYLLAGRFKVPGLDVAPFFRAADPGKPPTLESVIVAEGSFSGRGANLDDLIARVQGSVDATGGKGVYRGLARSSDLVSTGANIVGALFGGQKVQGATQAVTDLATVLRELHFDQMKLRLTRGEDLKLNIETLDLLSPTVRLSGKGVVNMTPGTPLVKQAQRLEMRLAFKSSLAEKFTQVRLTDGTTDELGYARFRVPIILTGNLMSPDSKQFWESVGRSAVEMGVQSFLGGQ